LDEQRQAFAVPPEIAYFNTANLSPQLHVVRAAGDAALERRAGPWTITAQDWFTDVERLRVPFGALIGADADGVALIPATSYGFAIAARNLPLQARERVVVAAAGCYAAPRSGRPWCTSGVLVSSTRPRCRSAY
jgi:kynureninase